MGGHFYLLFLTSIHPYNIGLKYTKFQPSRATMTIYNSNSFDLFSYGSESVFWYFQFQRLIADFSDNPLKLKLPAEVIKFAQSETYVFHFPKKWKFFRFGVNETSFLQDIQRKKNKKKSKKKVVKKCKKRQKSAMPFL